MTKYIEITTLSHFKLKYVIPEDDFIAVGFTEPVDTNKLIELINAGVFDEFSQTHLGEVIANIQEFDEADILTIFDNELPYLAEWTKERKLNYIKSRGSSLRKHVENL